MSCKHEWFEGRCIHCELTPMAATRAAYPDVEPSDLVAAGDGLLNALSEAQASIGCMCGDFGPCKRCTASNIASEAAAEAWEEAKVATHSLDCDVNDANLEGFLKPYNCGHPHPAGSVTPMIAARRLCPNWMSPTGDAHYRDVLEALQLQRESGKSEMCS